MEQNTLDAIMRLEGINNLQAAQVFIEEYSQELGFTSIACLKIAGPGEVYINNLYINTRPDEWSQRYLAENQPLHDPIIQELRRTSAPFSWKDVMGKPQLPNTDFKIIESARDFNMKDGLVVPILLQNGYAAVMSYTTDYMDIPLHARKTANLFGLYAHSKLHALFASCEKRVPLSSREREVMLWAAIGKTDYEVGNILGLSQKTVHQYVERAKSKLNATTRTYAVVQALRAGELNI